MDRSSAVLHPGNQRQGKNAFTSGQPPPVLPRARRARRPNGRSAGALQPGAVHERRLAAPHAEGEVDDAIANRYWQSGARVGAMLADKAPGATKNGERTITFIS